MKPSAGVRSVDVALKATYFERNTRRGKHVGIRRLSGAVKAKKHLAVCLGKKGGWAATVSCARDVSRALTRSRAQKTSPPPLPPLFPSHTNSSPGASGPLKSLALSTTPFVSFVQCSFGVPVHCLSILSTDHTHLRTVPWNGPRADRTCHYSACNQGT